MAIKVHQKKKFPNTQYPTRDPIGDPIPLIETHLAQTQFSIQKGGQNLPWSYKRPPQGGSSTFNIPDNEWVVERLEWKNVILVMEITLVSKQEKE